MILPASCSAVDPGRLAIAAKVGTSARIGPDAWRSITWQLVHRRAASSWPRCGSGRPGCAKDELVNATKLQVPNAIALHTFATIVCRPQPHASNLMLQSSTMCGLVCTSRPHTTEKSSGERSWRHKISRPFPMWSSNWPAWSGLNQPCNASVRLRAPLADRADSSFASFPTVQAMSWRDCEKCKCAISFSKPKLDAAGGTSLRACRTAPECNVASASRPTRTACNASQSSNTATTN